MFTLFNTFGQERHRGKIVPNVFAKASVLTASVAKQTPFGAIAEYGKRMPRFRDILPLSRLDKNARNSQIIEDVKTIVVREGKQAQFGTFYFYNEKGAPMGDTIKSSGLNGIEIPNESLRFLEMELKTEGIITQPLDLKTRGELTSLEIGGSLTVALGNREYTARKNGQSLSIKRETTNILHVPREFQEMKNVIAVCDLQDAEGMQIWADRGVTHGGFKFTKGIAVLEMFYQAENKEVRLAMDNEFNLPASRAAVNGETGMGTSTRSAKDGPAFGLASIIWRIPIERPSADFSNSGSDAHRALIWQ